MRLLNTSTLKLREFHDDEIPDYAILSHTWEDGEVSYQAMESAASEVVSAISEGRDEAARLEMWAAVAPTTLSGYTKITKSCTLAASEGWQYLWIDTCCIDKTSSAELSEAINSMYRWYKEAQVCYVYLIDVSMAHVSRTDLSITDVSITNVPRYLPHSFLWSRWFKRGWTLQELLAPSTVVFYDKDWREIGTRWSLRAEIERATGITYESMIRPESCSIAMKMSWASNRKTTRVEDIAYCLMGLFDINMPLLYGEGPKAFMRLQHEIVESGQDDESIFAWRDARLASSGMFARSPEAFADSGDIYNMRNLDPRAQPFRVTRTSIFFNRNSVNDNNGPWINLLTLSCASLRSLPAWIGVGIEESSSGTYVRSSPGRLLEYSFLRPLNVNHTLQMPLCFEAYRRKMVAFVKKRRIVLMQAIDWHRIDSFYLKRAHQSRDTSQLRTWTVTDQPLPCQKDNPTSVPTVLLESEQDVEGHFSRSGARIYTLDLDRDRPIVVVIFSFEDTHEITSYYALILATSEAAPKLDVLLLPNPTRDAVKQYLENIRDSPRSQSLGREEGADQLVLSRPENVGRDVRISMRKRIFENSKVYCVSIDYVHV